MRRVVVDAGVVVKWLFPDRDGERDVEEALRLLGLVRTSEVEVCQPAHWLAEVAAVVTRLSPDTALEDVEDLCDLGFQVLDKPDVYFTACRISLRLNHHLFDTLYHAVGMRRPRTPRSSPRTSGLTAKRNGRTHRSAGGFQGANESLNEPARSP